MTKTATTYNVAKIIAAGKLWENGSMRRVYFNNLREIYGLDASFYGTGSVSSATINGEKISNTQARKIGTDLDFGKLWFDLNTNEFSSKGLSDSAVSVLIANITA